MTNFMRESSLPVRGGGTRITALVRCWLLAAIAVTALAVGEAALGQDPPTRPQAPAEIDSQQLAARLAVLTPAEPNGELPPASAQEIALLKETQQFLEQASAQLAAADKFAGESRSAPEQLTQIDTYLASSTDDLVLKVDQGLSLEELQAQLETARVRLQTEQDLRARVETDAEFRGKRRNEIPAERAQATERLEELEATLAAGDNPDDPAELARAKRWRALAERFFRSAALAALDEELRNYDARRGLLDKRRAYRDRRITVENRNVTALQETIGSLQLIKAEEERKEAERKRRAAVNSHPLVKTILDQNQTITARNAEILSLKTSMADARSKAEALLTEWTTAAARSRSRVERVGLTNAIGQHLRSLRTRLPDITGLRQQMSARDREIGNLVNEVEDGQVLLEGLAEIDSLIDQRFSTSISDLPPPNGERDELRLAMREALLQQREYLNTLNTSISDYLDNTLVELQNTQRDLYELLEDFTSFIDERILWIRSTEAMQPGDLRSAGAALTWLADSDAWTAIGSRAWKDVGASTPVYGLFIPALLVLLILQPFLRRRLRSIAAKTGKFTTDRFSLTIESLLVSVLMAIALPAVISFIAWRLAVAAPDIPLAAGLSQGLFRTANLVFLAELIRILSIPGGVAAAHFRWRQQTLDAIWKPLRWLVPIVVPLTFIVAVTSTNNSHHASLGRLAFIIAMIAYSVFLQRVMRPSAGLMRMILLQYRGGWLDRLKYVWFPALVIAPLVMALLAGLGYFYSAVQLEQRVFSTIWLLLIVLIGRATLLRALFLAQWRLDIEQRRKKQAAQVELEKSKAQAAAASADRDGDDPSVSPDTPEPQAEPKSQSVPESEEVDIKAISAQTRQLLNTAVIFSILIGCAIVWMDMMPALGFLREIELWAPESSPAVVATVDPAMVGTGALELGAANPAPSDQGPITLGHVIYSVLILMVTVLLSRNMPGLLEIALLQRLPISPSGRYAITTVARYFLIILGLIVAFSAIGIGWSKVQWLAAAVTVGLGFGLQEIFANFVSGLIILFERPIRVGDTVTVAGTTGTVTRLRIRATTITDWDRKELIIPNKEFVTGQIINWSLTDPIVRLIIPVGIAYGSDTQLAEELLYQVARDDPTVLDEPQTRVVFEQFGDSSLNFSLRVFLPNIEHFLKVKHRLHNAIDQAFRKAGIVIAFPQRDVHLFQMPDQEEGAASSQPASED